MFTSKSKSPQTSQSQMPSVHSKQTPAEHFGKSSSTFGKYTSKKTASGALDISPRPLASTKLRSKSTSSGKAKEKSPEHRSCSRLFDSHDHPRKPRAETEGRSPGRRSFDLSTCQAKIALLDLFRYERD